MILLTSKNVPAALELSTAAGWNQTAADWRRLLELEPDGCFGIESDGRLAATATLLSYGTRLAWVGMVLTHSDYQRRGFARQLVKATLDVADERGIECVKLDATDQGHPLYAELGFVDEQPIERWYTACAASVVHDLAAPAGGDLDRTAFGADRTRFLRTLDAPVRSGDGFVYHRAGTKAHYLGPCVASSIEDARQLIKAAVARHPGEPWFWDILPDQTGALQLAREFGFAPIRRLVRMVRGSQISRRDDLVYAIGGFEAG